MREARTAARASVWAFVGDWGWVGVDVDEAAVVEEGVAEGDVDDVVVAGSDDILMCGCQDLRAKWILLQLGCVT